MKKHILLLMTFFVFASAAYSQTRTISQFLRVKKLETPEPATDELVARDPVTGRLVNTGITTASLSGGGATPGGANTQIQFNNNGAFGGSSNLTWDGTKVRVGSAFAYTDLAINDIQSFAIGGEGFRFNGNEFRLTADNNNATFGAYSSLAANDYVRFNFPQPNFGETFEIAVPKVSGTLPMRFNLGSGFAVSDANGDVDLTGIGGSSYLGINETGTPAGGNLIVEIGDFGNQSNQTLLTIDDANNTHTFSGGIVGRLVDLGTNDNLQGILRIYGNNLGTSGSIQLYNAAGTDTNVDSWTLTTDEDFRIQETGASIQMSVDAVTGVVRNDGSTIAEIDTEGAKALITKEYADANYSAGTTLYSADGSIPAAASRTLTVANGADLNFNTADGSSLFIGDGGGTGGSFSADFADISLSAGSNGINWSSAGQVEIIATNGLQLRPGTGGTITPSVVGQVMTANGTNGEAIWSDLPSLLGYQELNTPASGLQVNIGDYAVANNGTYINIDDENDARINFYPENQLVGHISNAGLQIQNGYNLSISEVGNPFGARFNLNSGAVTTTTNDFPLYNSINKQNATNSSALVYGQSNLIEHDGAGDISQLRGIYNRARSDGAGAPGEMIALFNEASYRNTGSSTTTLLNAMENLTVLSNTAGTGNIGTAVGMRSEVEQNNPNITVSQAVAGVFQIDLNEGNLDNVSVVSIDLDQANAATSELTNAVYLSFGDGIDIPEAQANGTKIIESVVDLPSTFDGTIQAKALITNSFTFATLPTGVQGMTATITDASSVAYRANAAGGGSDVALVFFDGTNWIYH